MRRVAYVVPPSLQTSLVDSSVLSEEIMTDQLCSGNEMVHDLDLLKNEVVER